MRQSQDFVLVAGSIRGSAADKRLRLLIHGHRTDELSAHQFAEAPSASELGVRGAGRKSTE